MSRISPPTTQPSSSSRYDPSPTVSVPSLSRGATQTSQSSAASFPGSNVFEDFVLFPEDAAAWNPADLPIAEDADLSDFNFDINDIDINDFPPMDAHPSYHSSRFDLALSFGFDDTFDSSPAMLDQYGLDQWASSDGYSMPVSHSRPHHASLEQDPGQLDPNPAGADSPDGPRQSGTSALAFHSPGFGQSSTSTSAEVNWPHGTLDHLLYAQDLRTDANHIPSSPPSRWDCWDRLEANVFDPAEMTSSTAFSQIQSRHLQRHKRNPSTSEHEQNLSGGPDLAMQKLALLVSLTASVLVLTRQTSFLFFTTTAIAMIVCFLPLTMIFPATLRYSLDYLSSIHSKPIDNSSSPVLTLTKWALCYITFSTPLYRLLDMLAQNMESLESRLAPATSSLMTFSTARRERLSAGTRSNIQRHHLYTKEASLHRISTTLFKPITLTAIMV